MGKAESPVLIKKGAEASLFLAEWHGRKVIMKKRLPKDYRPSRLDQEIRTYRTVHEPQLMHEVKKFGVLTPIIFLIDLRESTIVMEYIEGRQLKTVLGEASRIERQRLCFQIGELVGKLHKGGIVHGDLTTSNMILDREGRISFVDFGLGEKTDELEARGVDMHLLKRALQSTHFRFAAECFEAVVKGYSKALGNEIVKSVLDKIGEIERRGRYVSERRID